MNSWRDPVEDRRLQLRLEQLFSIFREALSANWCERRYGAGQALFEQGQESCDALFVDRGLVKLLYRDANGRESLISLRGRGWALGTAAALLRERHVLGAETVTECTVHAVAAPVFRDRVHTDRQLVQGVLHLHALELSDQLNAHVALVTATARERVLLLLHNLIGQDHRNRPQRCWVKLALPVPYRDMAQLAGITPETFSRILAELEQSGEIERGRGWVRVQSRVQ